jgi:hypothetical protein
MTNREEFKQKKKKLFREPCRKKNENFFLDIHFKGRIKLKATKNISEVLFLSRKEMYLRFNAKFIYFGNTDFLW